MGAGSVERVKQWLMKYQQGERTLDIMIERLEALEARLSTVSSPKLDGLPHGSPTYDRTLSLIAQKEQLEWQARKMVQSQTENRLEIERAVELLPKADEKAVLQMRYIDGEKWGDVAQMLFGSRDDFFDREDSYIRRTTKLHGQALQNLTRIMSEETGSRANACSTGNSTEFPKNI